MKVGKEIRAATPPTVESVPATRAPLQARTRRRDFLKAAFLVAVLLNILLLPINTSIHVSQAGLGGL